MAMLAALYATGADAESVLNDLDELGVRSNSVSVVARDPSVSQALDARGGPLARTAPAEVGAALSRLGFSTADADALAAGVTNGQILLTVEAPAQATASIRETLGGASTIRLAEASG
jgi:hypothetical protein